MFPYDFKIKIMNMFLAQDPGPLHLSDLICILLPHDP